MRPTSKRPQHLFSDWVSVKRSLENKFIYFFIDYDGTLSPIAGSPDKAVTSARTKALLRRLSRVKRCRVAVVSGRALADVSGRVGVNDITYVGNHGYEIMGPGIRLKTDLPAGYFRTLRTIKSLALCALGRFGGVFMEDKGPTMTLHYRRAAKRHIPRIVSLFNALSGAFRKEAHITRGKRSFEIKPTVRWDKGRSVLWLLRSRKYAGHDPSFGRGFPVYIGDDTTDEDAFKALEGRGLTVFVGRRGPTRADYRLDDTVEVGVFLKKMLDLFESKRP